MSTDTRHEDTCDACQVPVGHGDCEACIAVSVLLEDDRDEPICDGCGKPIYDWSDLGCGLCDARHPEYGIR